MLQCVIKSDSFILSAMGLKLYFKVLFHSILAAAVTASKRNTDLLRLKFHFESFFVTGKGIGTRVYSSNVWPHLSNVSLRF